jgi:hypothetical protein
MFVYCRAIIKSKIKMLKSKVVWHCGRKTLLTNFELFFFKLIKFLIFSDHFDVLMSKIIFKK